MTTEITQEALIELGFRRNGEWLEFGLSPPDYRHIVLRVNCCYLRNGFQFFDQTRYVDIPELFMQTMDDVCGTILRLNRKNGGHIGIPHDYPKGKL